jgi:D-threo-aldose 1-dehydrogenase
MITFNAAPFGGGILASGARAGATYAYRPASAGLVDWVARVERACAEHGVSLRTAALRFSTRSSLVDSTVVGISSVQRLRELEELAATEVPDGLWDAIDACGPAPSTEEDA